MDDTETFRSLIRRLEIAQYKAGSCSIESRWLKHLTVSGEYIQATPALSNFLWNLFLHIAEIHSDRLKFIDHFSFEDDSNKTLMLYDFGGWKFEESIMQSIKDPNESILSTLTDRSVLKTSINSSFAKGRIFITKESLPSLITEDLSLFIPSLAQWEQENWIKMIQDPIHSSLDTPIIEILNPIDNALPGY